jgi:trans-2,3-dihydro-3-hydroxyanthranilate isomerase
VIVEFLQVDVFAERPLEGNPLAVFPDAKDLTRGQMSLLAREMNLSETTFVQSTDVDSYELRIFTPAEELPFAGHPTIGTAWALKHAGVLTGDQVVQRSGVGETVVTFDGELVWFERPGTAEADLEDREMDVHSRLARALGITERDLGLEARELGRSGRLRPAHSNAGVGYLMVPLANVNALSKCRPVSADLEAIAPRGVFCFTATQAGRVRARGFFSGVGIEEDPGTGSAAAGLGIYLADRLGSIEFEVLQGVEMARPSRMLVRAQPGTVRVGGHCRLALTGNVIELAE